MLSGFELYPRWVPLKLYINGRENGRKPQKGTPKTVNEFFTILPPKT